MFDDDLRTLGDWLGTPITCATWKRVALAGNAEWAMAKERAVSVIGVVAIGRNEGERLKACLRSAAGNAAAVVYVDSGSTDGSVEFARSVGVDVVSLDMSKPFTAARARNAGFDRLLESRPDADLVQFVDGDCEIVAGWMARASAELERRPEVVVVCGRRRERHPEASVYNRLCDIEWDTPVGEADACGGDAMMRVRALREVGGYNPTLIAGEEPELCVRLRRRGGKVVRIGAEMTLHDAAMMRFSQWWKRAVRGGHAYAEGAAMHGRSPQRHWVRESRRIWAWGLGLPLVALALAWPTRGLSLLLLPLGFGFLMFRVWRWSVGRGLAAKDARAYALFCALAKIPECVGQCRYVLGRLTGRRSGLIEYKGAGSAPGAGQRGETPTGAAA